MPLTAGALPKPSATSLLNFLTADREGDARERMPSERPHAAGMQ